MKIHILLATLLFAAPALVSAQNDAKDDPAGNLQKFQQFYRYLNGAYVDTVHNNELVESAIREVLLQLDPHSTYVSPEEMVEVKESFDGSFSGIGIEFNVLRDTIIVVNVISGGPAEQVGLLPNDRIVAVDGKSSVGVKQIDVPKLLRGPKGSRVAANRSTSRSCATTFRSIRWTPPTRSIRRPVTFGSTVSRTILTRSSRTPCRNWGRWTP